MTRTCKVRQHERRLPPRLINNRTHDLLRGYVAELRFAEEFNRAFDAEMRKPWLVASLANGLTEAAKKWEIV